MVTVQVHTGCLKSVLALTKEQQQIFSNPADDLQKRLYALQKDLHVVHSVNKQGESVIEGANKIGSFCEEEMHDFNEKHLNFIEEAEKIYESWEREKEFKTYLNTKKANENDEDVDDDDEEFIRNLYEDLKKEDLVAFLAVVISPHVAFPTEARIGAHCLKKLVNYYVENHK